jgi:hypothetical protein
MMWGQSIPFVFLLSKRYIHELQSEGIADEL